MRKNAVVGLGRSRGPIGATVAAELGAALRDANSGVRREAAAALDSMGLDSREVAAPELIRTLMRGDREARHLAAKALADIGLPDDHHLRSLVRRWVKRALADRDWRTRVAAVSLIDSLTVVELSGALKQAVHDGDGRVRAAVLARQAISGEVSYEEGDYDLRAILGGLRDPDAGVRTTASELIGDLCFREHMKGANGHEAWVAASALLPLLRDRECTVRGAAVVALECMTSPNPATHEAVVALVDMLHDRNTGAFCVSEKHYGEEVTDVAIAAVLNIKDTDAVIAQLIAALDDKRYPTTAVETVLERIGEDAVPALIAVLNNPDAGQREKVARVLERIGTRAARDALRRSNHIDS